MAGLRTSAAECGTVLRPRRATWSLVSGSGTTAGSLWTLSAGSWTSSCGRVGVGACAWFSGKVLEPDDQELVETLKALVALRAIQGRDDEATAVLKRLRSVLLRGIGQDDQDAGGSFGFQPSLSWDDQIIPMAEKAIAVLEKVYGLEHPGVAAGLIVLSNQYNEAGAHDKAEESLKRALAIREKALGPRHLEVAATLSDLAGFLVEQERYDEAKLPCERALAIRREVLGEDHPDVAAVLSTLATICKKEDPPEYDEAKSLLSARWLFSKRCWDLRIRLY